MGGEEAGALVFQLRMSDVYAVAFLGFPAFTGYTAVEDKDFPLVEDVEPGTLPFRACTAEIF